MDRLIRLFITLVGKFESGS